MTASFIKRAIEYEIQITKLSMVLDSPLEEIEEVFMAYCVKYPLATWKSVAGDLYHRACAGESLEDLRMILNK